MFRRRDWRLLVAKDTDVAVYVVADALSDVTVPSEQRCLTHISSLCTAVDDDVDDDDAASSSDNGNGVTSPGDVMSSHGANVDEELSGGTVGRGGARKKKTRTVFSRGQVEQLETTFETKRYLSSAERSGLAAVLRLSETQVKIWFQNRRNKWKRQMTADLDSSVVARHHHALQAVIHQPPPPPSAAANDMRLSTETRHSVLDSTSSNGSTQPLMFYHHPLCFPTSAVYSPLSLCATANVTSSPSKRSAVLTNISS